MLRFVKRCGRSLCMNIKSLRCCSNFADSRFAGISCGAVIGESMVRVVNAGVWCNATVLRGVLITD